MTNALVLFSFLAAHDPQAGTANDGVLGRAVHIGVIRQGANAVSEFAVACDVAIQRGRACGHGAFARHKGGVSCVATTLVNEQAALGHVGQILNVANMQRRVERQTGIHTAHAVAFGGKFCVVPSREALELGPADPAGGEWALVATGFQFGSGQGHFGPCCWGFFGVYARCLEGVFVVVEDRSGAVKWKAQHLAIGRGVVASHCWDVRFLIKFQTGVLHHFANGHDGAFAGHHGGSAHFKHLKNVGGIARAEGRNGGSHGFVVTALEGWHNFVIFLAGVEIFGLVIDPFTQSAAHGVPPLNLGLGLDAHAEGGDGQRGQRFFVIHKYSFGCVIARCENCLIDAITGP